MFLIFVPAMFTIYQKPKQPNNPHTFPTSNFANTNSSLSNPFVLQNQPKLQLVKRVLREYHVVGKRVQVGTTHSFNSLNNPTGIESTVQLVPTFCRNLSLIS